MSNETYYGYDFDFTNKIESSKWNDSYSKFTVQIRNNIHEKFVFTLPMITNHLIIAEEIIDYAVTTKKPLFITSFVISYKKVIDKLIEANKVLKGKIFILTPIEKNDLKAVLINSNEIDEHLSGIQLLVKEGIRIRSISNGHWKLLVAGTDLGMITSANITQAAYEKNPEFGIYFSDTVLLSDIKKWFAQAWKNGSDKELLTNNRIFPLKSNKFSFSPNFFTSNQLTLYNALNNKAPYQNVLKLINEAKKEIKILTYLLTDEKIIKLLVDKAEKGIKIKIALPLLRSGRPDVLKAINSLNHQNIEIKMFLETHAKVIIIDDGLMMFSTGNFDNYLKNSDSLDILIQTNSMDIIENFSKFFDWVFENSSRQQETLFIKKLGTEKTIGILIPSPLSVIPNLTLSLDRVIDSWKGSEITFFENEAVLVIKTDKKSFLWQLEKSGINFKMKENKNTKIDLQNKEGIIYENILFKFVWMDYP